MLYFVNSISFKTFSIFIFCQYYFKSLNIELFCFKIWNAFSGSLEYLYEECKSGVTALCLSADRQADVLGLITPYFYFQAVYISILMLYLNSFCIYALLYWYLHSFMDAKRIYLKQIVVSYLSFQKFDSEIISRLHMCLGQLLLGSMACQNSSPQKGLQQILCLLNCTMQVNSSTDIITFGSQQSYFYNYPFNYLKKQTYLFFSRPWWG